MSPSVLAAFLTVRNYEKWFVLEGAQYVAEFRRAVFAFEAAVRADERARLQASDEASAMGEG